MFEERFFKNPLSDALVVTRCSATSELSQQQSVKRRKRERGGEKRKQNIGNWAKGKHSAVIVQ